MAALFTLRGFSCAVAVMALLGCGNDGSDGGAADAGSATGAIDPCRLATADQVATVLPGHDGGSVAHAGRSLMQGVDAYQCSYMNSANDLLTVIVNVAADEERFDAIQKSRSFHSEHQPVAIADAAWVWGDDDDQKVQVEKGRAIMDVELLAKGAEARSAALVELARAAAANIPSSAKVP